MRARTLRQGHLRERAAREYRGPPRSLQLRRRDVRERAVLEQAAKEHRGPPCNLQLRRRDVRERAVLHDGEDPPPVRLRRRDVRRRIWHWKEAEEGRAAVQDGDEEDENRKGARVVPHLKQPAEELLQPHSGRSWKVPRALPMHGDLAFFRDIYFR